MELTELKGTGAVEVTDPVLIAKASEYNAIKKAKDALEVTLKTLGDDLKDDFIALGHEQMLLNGTPILTADVSYSDTLDREYLARRAPVAFRKAHKPRKYFLRLTSSGKVRG